MTVELQAKTRFSSPEEEGYVRMTSSLFFPSEGGKFISKKLYCLCGEELYGEAKSFPIDRIGKARTPVIRGDTNPYFYFECSSCAFRLTGDEARFLHLAFTNDLI